jgi:hypothetical protein
MRELVLRRICGISSAQFVAKNRGILAHGEVFHCESECAFYVLHRCSLAWIISANRMLSEIFAVTDGEGLISSRFSRTAAIKDAAMRIAAFCRFSLLLGLFDVFSIFRRSGQVLLGDG